MKILYVVNPNFLCFCFLISIASHSQDQSAGNLFKESTQSVATLNWQANDHLKKSKKKRNTGLILLGSGAVCFGAGAYALEHARDKNGYGAIIMLGGMGMAAASLYFFISSAITNSKANISMKREALLITPQQQSNISYHSISLQFNL